MLIFAKQFIIFFVLFFAPVQLTNYALKRADFNTGQLVYTNNVQLCATRDALYKITSSEGQQAFGMWDYVSMIGPYVELRTYDSNPKIRCEFDSQTTAQNLYSNMKPKIYPDIRFPLISTEILRCPAVENCEIIVGGYLGVEFRNRFYILSETNHTIEIIFSRGIFNVSSVLPGGRIIIVVPTYKIDERKMTAVKLLLTFGDDDVARSFHHYVNQAPSCTNELIPVVLPDNFAP